jgi:hypothetical protein
MILPSGDPEDFSVVVKRRAPDPKPWRWEIYRAGRTSPIESSKGSYASMSLALRDGKAALRLLMTRTHKGSEP